MFIKHWFPRHSPRRGASGVASAGLGALALCAVSTAASAQCSTAIVKPAAETWKGASYRSHGAQLIIYTGPTDHGSQLQLANGIDKSLWVTLIGDSSIMKFSINGKAEIYATPTPNAGPESITATTTKMWFTEWAQPCVASITAGGRISEFNTGLSETKSTGMATGTSQIPWFATDYAGIGRISASGKSKLFSFADEDTQPTAITLGPDGNIWFIENTGNNVGKITPAGKVTEYNANFLGASYSFGIAAGSDGRIWFADNHNSRIGAINTNGTGLTYYSTGLTADPISIVAGPDGNLYFGETEPNGGRTTAGVGRITTTGKITEFLFPVIEGAFPVISLAVGPDKNIWFSNNAHSQIGKLKLPID